MKSTSISIGSIDAVAFSITFWSSGSRGDSDLSETEDRLASIQALESVILCDIQHMVGCFVGLKARSGFLLITHSNS